MQENNFIPANYTDAGKIMGTFPIRNALEALVCVVPIVLVVMMLPVFAMLTRLMIALVLAVPIGGFTLLGVHDESMLQFLQTWLQWHRNRGKLFYRG